MDQGTAVPGKAQGVEKSTPGTGKNRPKRLKARHVSDITRREIIREFAARQSFDDVADEMSVPGLTGKTVSEVVSLYLLRRPPGMEVSQDRRGFTLVNNRRSA